MAEVGSAFVSILPSARGFGRSLTSQVSGEADSSGRSIGKTFGTALKIGAVAVAGGAALLGGFLKGSLDEAREAQKVGAQTNAVIKSTGGVANVTAGQVNRLAASISRKTGIDDEAIASGENLLLTFTNVRNEAGKGNDIFNQATKTLVDMGAALGGDASSSAIQLGKALNDPVKGITALTRVGVTFTQQQKDQIASMVEAGRTADAQKIILRELNKEFGGSAEAAATAGDKFKVAFGNLQESVGTALLPLWDSLLNVGTRFATVLTNNIGPGIAALNGFIAPVVGAFQHLFADGFMPVEERARSFGEILDNVFGNTGTLVGPIGQVGKVLFELAHGFEAIRAGAQGFTGDSGIIGAFEQIGATVAQLGPQVGATIRAVVTAAGGLVGAFAPFVASVLPAFISAGQRIALAVMPAIQSIAQVVSSQLVPAFQRILPILAPVVRFLVGVFGGAVVGAIQGIAQTVRGIITVISGVINTVAALLTGDWAAAWEGIKQIVRGAVTAVIGLVKTYLYVSILRIFSLGIAGIRALWSAFGTGLQTIAKSFLGNVLGVFRTVLAQMRGLVTGVINGIRGLWGNFFGFLRSAAVAAWNSIKSATSNAISAVKSAVSNGVAAVRSAFQNAMQAVVTAVIGGFNQARNAASNGVSSVLETLRGIPGRAAAALGNLGSTLYNAGAALIQGLINGITSRISAVTEKMSELASKVKGFLPGSPIKEGPLKAWNNTGPTGPGGQLVGMLAKGMGNVAPVRVASKDLANTIAENFRTDTFADNFTLQGALTSLKMDTRRASEFSKAARQAKKLGLDGGVMESLLSSGNTALLQDITSTKDVQALERAWRQRNKATDFFDAQNRDRERQKDREALRQGAREGTREGFEGRHKRDREGRKSRARRAVAP